MSHTVPGKSETFKHELKMKPSQYVALLRGINVGGNNIIKMTELKICLEKAGFSNVATYIQSGNVLFETPETNLALLTGKIEKALSKQFNYQSSAVIVSHDELKHVVGHAPKGFGSQPAKYRYDVIFLKAPLTAKDAFKSVTTKAGVDQAYAGRGALYFSRLIAKAAQSRLSRIAQLPVYRSMTIRNWNTTTKLLGLMDARN